MQKIRKFRAVQKLCQAGVFGATMLALLGGDAVAQTGTADVRRSVNQAALNDRSVELKFYGSEWGTVMKKVAEQSGSILVMHETPPGRLVLREKEPFNRHEAVLILNRELEPTGFRILESDRYLIVMHQRSMRTRYRRPDRPSQPEWSPNPADVPQFELAQTYKRSVTAIATKEQEPKPPQPLQLVEGTKPIPVSADQAQASQNPNGYSNSVVTPTAYGESPAGWSSQSLTPKNKVRNLAGRVYETLKDRAELIDAGVEGLPAFRVQFPPAPDKPRVEGFEVAIDIPQNRLVFASTPERLKLLSGLFRYLDRQNAFQEPIRLVAADERAAELAKNLTPEIEKMIRARDKLKAKPKAAADAGRNVTNRLEQEWALAQAQAQQPPANAQQPNTTQVVPAQPVPPALSGLSILTNIKGNVDIQAIPELGIMILRGNQADVDALVKVIQQIQKQTAGAAPAVRLLLLHNLNSESLAELLRTVYDQLGTIRTRTGQARQQTSFIPIARPNAVMILAPQAEMQSIENLANELDRPIDPQTNIDVFYLKNAVASQAAATITNLYQAQTGAAAPAAGATGTAAATGVGLQPRYRIVADVRTNSLIVQARPNDMKELAYLIDKIDLEETAAVSKMRIVPLKNAVADELANVITSAIQSLLNPPSVTGRPPQGQTNQLGQGGAGGQGPQELRDAKSVVLELLANVGEQEMSVRSGILSDIRVTPDIRSNSLIVSAPEQSLEMMVALIQQLDQPTSTVAEIKVFTLENADANTVLNLLTALFAPTTGNQAQAQTGVQIVGAEDASSGLIPLRFSVDVRTNSIVAIGGGDALRVVEAILLRLDQSDIRQRQNTIVKLRNTPATEIAAAINTFLQSQRDLATINPDLVSNTELLEQQIIAVAEPVTNSLLISATPRYFKEIQDLVAKLDQSPKQVVIQVLLVQVTLDNTDEFGVELGFQDDILFDRSVTTAADLLTISQTNTSPNGVATTTQNIISQATTPGFKFADPTLGLGNNIAANPNIVGTQSLSNFSLGRMNSDLGYGGLVLSASSNQVSMLMRALSARTQVHILSRPQIRTLDNQVAQIQVGQQVPIVNGVTFGGTNNQVIPLVVQDSAGIILTVTPRISPEENIVMEVVAEKSAFTGAGVTLFVDTNSGNTVTSPIKDIITARTTVGVPNGQTVILGGMITKNDQTIERKIPWLGDLPYFGLPFRYDSTHTVRTELLMFLTPRIVRCDADNELIKQVETERTHAIEQEIEAIHGPIFAVPAGPGYPSWMDGNEFCPPLEGEPGSMMPEEGYEIPAPGPAPTPAPVPGVPPQVPYDPAIPPSSGTNDQGQSWDDRNVPTTIVPVSGYRQTSPTPPQFDEARLKAVEARKAAQAPSKRPWYSWKK